jgi:hypothetical protein
MMVSDQVFALAIVTVGKVPPVSVTSGNKGGRVGLRIGLEDSKKTKPPATNQSIIPYHPACGLITTPTMLSHIK